MEANSVENGGEEDLAVAAIKKRIRAHPMYGLLIETHFNCLKVSLGNTEDVGVATSLDQADVKPSSTAPSLSDLDRFMEEYCMALGKLKEAMEKPIQETEAFINSMYAQLSELDQWHQPNKQQVNGQRF